VASVELKTQSKFHYMTPAIAALIATSSALFETTTGFAYSDLVSLAGSVILVILGGGLGLVNALLGCIIAIVIVSVIIGLIYHALRWLHIL